MTRQVGIGRLRTACSGFSSSADEKAKNRAVALTAKHENPDRYSPLEQVGVKQSDADSDSCCSVVWPDGQLMHDVRPALEYFPASHTLQPVRQNVSSFPAGQAMQLVKLCAEAS